MADKKKDPKGGKTFRVKRPGALVLSGVLAALCLYFGAASALFGSHGALRRWTQNRPKDPTDDEGSDE